MDDYDLAMPEVTLRDVTDADVSTFYEHLRDPLAVQMAAFVAKSAPDFAAHAAHWAQNRSDPKRVARSIVVDGHVAGNVVAFMHQGRRQVAYWVGREHWGRGVATSALSLLLQQVTERPIYAQVAKDNVGSIRVLQKCGFSRIDVARGFAPARGEEIEEFVFELRV